MARAIRVSSKPAQLAAALGISEEAAAQILANSRPVRKYRARTRKPCGACGTDFLPAAPAQIFCDRCRITRLLGRAI